MKINILPMMHMHIIFIFHIVRYYIQGLRTTVPSRLNTSPPHHSGIGGSRGGLRELQPPFQISKIKESNKTKQKIEDNPLEKEEERKSFMFV